MEQKKIAYIITRGDIGGAQNHLITLIKHFQVKHHLVLITGTEGPLTVEARLKGVSVELVPAIDSMNFVAATFQVFRVLRRHAPDLVHTHSSLASLYGRVAAKFVKAKVLYTVHGWHFANVKNRFKVHFQIFIEFCFRPLTDSWIVVSKFDKELGLNHRLFRDNRVRYIANGVADVVEPKDNYHFSKFSLVFVGRASYQKNCEALIDVLENTNEYVCATIYTSGEGVCALGDRIAHSVARERCEVILNEPNAGLLLSQYDLMIVTSRYEGMPLSVLEGLRAGLPIISTEVCGMNEVVQVENGFTVPFENIADMSQYVERLRNDSELHESMGRASRALYEAEFSDTKMLQKTDSVYADLLNV